MSKIMLVEDDNNLREIYEARLRAEGYEIVSAQDGEEALVVAKAEKPDLVISDVMMPKISGFEMLDILRNTDGMKEVKVIMLTALGQSEDQNRAEKLGADRYLVKSQVTLEDIVNVSHELLGDNPAATVAPSAAPTSATTSTKQPLSQPTTATTTEASADAQIPATSGPPTVVDEPVPPTTPPPVATTPTQPEPAVSASALTVETAAGNNTSDKPVTLPTPSDPVAPANTAQTPPDPSATEPQNSTPGTDTQPTILQPAPAVPEAMPEDASPDLASDSSLITPVSSAEPTPGADATEAATASDTKSAGKPEASALPEVPQTDSADVPVVTENDTSTLKSDSVASSTAQEEAAVEAKIEDFVAGATTDPTTPGSSVSLPGAGDDNNSTTTPDQDTDSASSDASDASNTPAASPDMSTDNEGERQSPEAAENDDKIINNALDTLVSGTDEAKAEASKDTGTTITPDDSSAQPDAMTTADSDNHDQPTSAPTIQPDAERIEPTEEAADGPSTDSDDSLKEPKNDNVTIAHKKIIQPLDTKPKRNLDELLAIEEAKQAGDGTVPAPTTIISGEAGSPTQSDTPATNRPKRLLPDSGRPTENQATTAPGSDPSDIAL